MKKCPVCDKTFDDSMRFCQTDGTALTDDVVEATPVDPFKTMVGRPDDIMPEVTTPDDPFKTMVAGAKPREDSGDLLQLPEEYDALKTSVVSQSEMRDELGLNEPQEDSPSDYAPSSPFEAKPYESPDIFSSAPPEPPKFSEPSLNPPDFGDAASTGFTEGATEIIPPESIPPSDSWGASPNNQWNEPAIPSPFGDAPQSSYEKPSTPIPSYKEPDPPPTVMGANPFDQPPMFGQQDQFNQPAQQNDWTPPPAPVSNWQDQGLGANTPFQPPAATVGQNQTLAIVSLVSGIAGILFCQLAAPVAVVTGFMARKKATQNPNEYGGSGLALAGIITGAIGTVLLLLVLLYIIFVFAFIGFNNF